MPPKSTINTKVVKKPGEKSGPSKTPDKVIETPTTKRKKKPVIIRLSHKDRAVRRRAIADAVRAGVPTHLVCKTYGVTRHMVFEACKEHNVDIPK